MDSTAEILSKTNFSTVDWVIVICYPLISVLLGLIARKYIASMKDFVTAGQSLGTALGVATLTGTELGLITVMYMAEKGFKGGFAAFHIALAAGVVTLFVGLSGFLIYRLRAMEVLTIPEFYERRFGRKTRILGGLMMAFGGILNMGLFLKVGSMFIVGVTGLSAESWALPAVMIFLLSLVLIYTVLGGMVSVVLADYVQFVVLSFGLLITTVIAVNRLGWNHIFATIDQFMGAKGFDPTVAEGEFGVEYIVWMGFLGLIGCAVWPTSVARALAAESPQTVKRQFTFGAVSYLIRWLIPQFWGICAFVFIMTHDAQLKGLFFPETAGVEPFDARYAMPIFLGRILPPVLLGVISAGMVAAFMSTHDSYLLCWSTVLTQDVVAPMFGGHLSTRARILLSRTLIVVIGLYVLWWGLFYRGTEDVWDYMAVTGAIYFTGAFAVLAGGLYWKRASSTGAVLALLAGCTALLGLTPVQGLFGVTIPSARVGLVSIGATIAAMVFGSLLFPDRTGKGEQVLAARGPS
ncbi:MAG TPA: sodium:solute symporter family protein [Planctomycetaceae bacterium]|nr:sodium:solute symporter family protein [Planctomycetaceae bacterium]HIQ20892.1 sodium:solute symporter family protein [Planctomycetota bacterium]